MTTSAPTSNKPALTSTRFIARRSLRPAIVVNSLGTERTQNTLPMRAMEMGMTLGSHLRARQSAASGCTMARARRAHARVGHVDLARGQEHGLGVLALLLVTARAHDEVADDVPQRVARLVGLLEVEIACAMVGVSAPSPSHAAECKNEPGPSVVPAAKLKPSAEAHVLALPLAHEGRNSRRSS